MTYYNDPAIPRFEDPEDYIDEGDTRQCAFCDSHIRVETKSHECPVCLEEDNKLSSEKQARLEANRKAFAEMLKREGLGITATLPNEGGLDTRPYQPT